LGPAPCSDHTRGKSGRRVRSVEVCSSRDIPVSSAPRLQRNRSLACSLVSTWSGIHSFPGCLPTRNVVAFRIHGCMVLPHSRYPLSDDCSPATLHLPLHQITLSRSG